jgi:hypothetical protein
MSTYDIGLRDLWERLSTGESCLGAGDPSGSLSVGGQDITVSLSSSREAMPELL